MGDRRKSRECALQILYAVDLSSSSVQDALSCFWNYNSDLSEEAKSFTEDLVQGVVSKQEEIDSIISNYSANWKLSRMAAVDRNILRVAVFELNWCKDIPHRVTLNEAIEIAKQYGTEDSGAFVNGILDQVAKNVQKEPGVEIL